MWFRNPSPDNKFVAWSTRPWGAKNWQGRLYHADQRRWILPKCACECVCVLTKNDCVIVLLTAEGLQLRQNNFVAWFVRPKSKRPQGTKSWFGPNLKRYLACWWKWPNSSFLKFWLHTNVGRTTCGVCCCLLPKCKKGLCISFHLGKAFLGKGEPGYYCQWTAWSGIIQNMVLIHCEGMIFWAWPWSQGSFLSFFSCDQCVLVDKEAEASLILNPWVWDILVLDLLESSREKLWIVNNLEEVSRWVFVLDTVCKKPNSFLPVRVRINCPQVSSVWPHCLLTLTFSAGKGLANFLLFLVLTSRKELLRRCQMSFTEPCMPVQKESSREKTNLLSSHFYQSWRKHIWSFGADNGSPCMAIDRFTDWGGPGVLCPCMHSGWVCASHFYCGFKSKVAWVCVSLPCAEGIAVHSESCHPHHTASYVIRAMSFIFYLKSVDEHCMTIILADLSIWSERRSVHYLETHPFEFEPSPWNFAIYLS